MGLVYNIQRSLDLCTQNNRSERFTFELDRKGDNYLS